MKVKKLTIIALGIILLLSAGFVASAEVFGGGLQEAMINETSEDTVFSGEILEQEPNTEILPSEWDVPALTEEELAEIHARNEELLRKAYEESGKEYIPDKVYEPSPVDSGEVFYTNRESALIKKGMPLDSPRITLEQVYEIIGNSSSIREIKSKMDEIHGGFDYFWGSGLSYLEYVIDVESNLRVVVGDYVVGLSEGWWSIEKETLLFCVDGFMNENTQP